jgi:hypothetical protein
MELHERLLTAPTVATTPGQDPFSELKDRVHLAVIGDLGPQLFNVNIEPESLRERVVSDIRTHLARDGDRA